MSLSILLAIALLVGLGIWWRRRRPIRGRSPLSLQPAAAVHGQTRRQLMRLVGGNRATAERLLAQVRQRYPGESEQWYWEKAIYDICRDRRS